MKDWEIILPLHIREILILLTGRKCLAGMDIIHAGLAEPW